MNEKEKRQKRIYEVTALLEDFCKSYLSPELSEYVFKLWEQLGRKRTYPIIGGRKENWASAVIYVIARLNFLFDRGNKYHITPDTICEFFRTNKNTVSSKATDIEKACKIRMGQEGLCSQDISDTLSFVQLSNGIILSKRQAKNMGLL